MDQSTINLLTPFIKDQDRVLDLGCGTGELLAWLKQHKHCQAYGIDIDFNNVVACTQKGLPVFQGNLNEGLSEFPDNSYDVIILSQTMQQIQDPIALLHAILQKGRIAIVTFPNFSHWHVRLQLFFGKIPQTKHLPYSWYNTPNIRVVSIHSFKRVCKEQGIHIQENLSSSHYPSWLRPIITPFSNLLFRRGVFVLSANK